MSTTVPFRHLRTALVGLAAALVLSLVTGTSEGRTALAAFLAQFRSQNIAVISFDPDQPHQPFFELSHLGDLQVSPSDRPEPAGVSSIAEASQKVGFSLKQPERAALPKGVPSEPAIFVTPAREIRFTFDQAKARRYFSENNKPTGDLLGRFDGATLVLSLPPAALLEYRRGGPNRLMIGQMSEITVGTEGKVSLDEMREFLLSLPGLAPDTVRQLRDIKDWRSTLPLPIPADELAWERTTIGGDDALLFRENSGLGSAVIWVRDGRISGVAGTATPAEIERVANNLAR